MIRIVTDSSCDLPADLVSRHGITVVPLTVRFGHDEFVDGVDLSPIEFWSRLAESSDLPATAAPPSGRFADAYATCRDAGADGVVVLTLSADLSATHQSAQLAVADTPGIDVVVVDSRLASGALGMAVLVAAKRAASGADLETVAAMAQLASQSSNVIAALDTLDNLRAGGRIGSAAAFFGGLLNVKPLVTFQNGVVAAAGRVRTRSRALAELAGHATRLAPRLDDVLIVHGMAPDVEEFAAQIAAVTGREPPAATLAGPVIGTHAGPGLIGLAYRLQ